MIKLATRSSVVVTLFFLASCAQIATVKQHEATYISSGRPDLAAADVQLATAQKADQAEPLAALGGYLTAAEEAADLLKRSPNDSAALHAYNYAVGRSVELISWWRLDPWHHPFTASGPRKTYTVTGIIQPGPDRDPSNYDIIPTDTLTEGGAYFQEKVTRAGLGMPVVAVGREESKNARKNFAMKRFYGTATAFVRFDGHRATFDFALPLSQDTIELNGHTYPLAADFTAQLALALARERPDKLGLIRMLRPERYADTAHLTRLQLYDPNRIPVIFVHGLQDTPASWAPMINSLRGDPEIRKNYQFWVYSYPSGYPYPYSAALFRKEIEGIDKVFPDHKKIVLVGHSMGGIISRLMITDVGDKVWYDFFGKAPAETNVPGPTRTLLEESLIFNHRPEVSRVVFICAPHRGAPMGSNWIGRIGSSLIKMPFFMASIPTKAIAAAMIHDAAAVQMKRIPNSIDTLSPNNRFVLEIEKFPTVPGIPFHTIEGDRGRGDAPNSSDGVVPYWSSHMAGARSDLIVPSNHSAPRNPQAIAEVKRILRLHLKSQGETPSNRRTKSVDSRRSKTATARVVDTQ